MLGVSLADRLIFFRWQVHQNGTIDTRVRGGGGKFAVAHSMDRIGVTHQNERCFLICLAEPFGKGENVAQSGFIRECPQR